LAESWSVGDANQPAEIAADLGGFHSVQAAGLEFDGFRSGAGLVSRWPIARSEHVSLAGVEKGDEGLVLFAEVEGPRGPVHVFVTMLTWRPDHSHVRQQQVRQLALLIRERTNLVAPAIACGDFNAGPDSEEMRMLTGASTAAAPRMVFYDAWETAGAAGPGHTWSNENPHAAVALMPSRRIDYVLSAWPRARGAGHPVHCERIGDQPVDGVWASDHFGVVADLRY
jgi:endonuclease/exonuclease/phosphatase family metal-dependent hydrolase